MSSWSVQWDTLALLAGHRPCSTGCQTYHAEGDHRLLVWSSAFSLFWYPIQSQWNQGYIQFWIEAFYLDCWSYSYHQLWCCFPNIQHINLNSSEKQNVEGCFEKSQTSDSFTALCERACAKVSLAFTKSIFGCLLYPRCSNTERCLRVIL